MQIWARNEEMLQGSLGVRENCMYTSEHGMYTEEYFHATKD